MTIVNRRNAVVGWAVLKLGKRKAKKAAPSGGSAAKAGAAAGGLAALTGVLFFWRRKRSTGDSV